MLIPPHILLAVDDQHGSSVALLHGVEYEIALSGQHSATSAGDVAAFVLASSGSCIGSYEAVGTQRGGTLDGLLSFRATLPAGVYTRCACCTCRWRVWT